MKDSGNIINCQNLKTRKHLKAILYLILIVAFASCQDVKKTEIPDDLISQEKMVDILTDLYISNASRNVNNKLIKKKNLQLDSIIYKKYQVDSLQFLLSSNYYSSDLQVYENLLNQVQDRLVVLQKEKDSTYKVIFKQDSINKIKNKSPKLKEIEEVEISSDTLISPAESN